MGQKKGFIIILQNLFFKNLENPFFPNEFNNFYL